MHKYFQLFKIQVTDWLKDGSPISDPNFIHSSSGSLLILQARMADTGNYTCVASNGAGGIERKSAPAQVKVYGE